MIFVKKNRLNPSVVGLSLSLLIAGTALLSSQAASAATTTTNGAVAAATAMSTSRADSIVRTAKSYIGDVTYRYGTRNTSRLILDCSAYTQLVFSKNGIKLPWGSQAQAKLGTRVSKKTSLSKGDLVMFSTSTPGRINHVGIYIGNGQFISNTTSSGVVIRSMTSGYWKDRFIMGRHV
ncbi:Murein DD-endopeptidase MepS/Murein LD-carboxypeptidase [Paenibacillus allorhizoplanae]|uniref:Murein DD-endopeptidase MepS/Murein LD-carboxypeptidase n=1 Tax=Paenibacillus allorhizoplanae TaxID=2905648 RepID=A0ABN8HBP2_9BACL|nr:C40 family peptidase [Paenibacillus allorhizoplanae]CAH1228350.1 Murein DD-endopeptidase MepS/Murein LD-carboxypeptidase [Paenibacillus allorhizoplanae]